MCGRSNRLVEDHSSDEILEYGDGGTDVEDMFNVIFVIIVHVLYVHGEVECSDEPQDLLEAIVESFIFDFDSNQPFSQQELVEFLWWAHFSNPIRSVNAAWDHDSEDDFS